MSRRNQIDGQEKLTIAVYLVHFFPRDADDLALLDDPGVLAADVLDLLELFQGDDGLDTFRVLPFDNLLLIQIDYAVVDLALWSNGDDIGTAGRPRCLFRVCEPGQHLGLARLIQGDSIETERAILLPDQGDNCVDFGGREGIEGVGRGGGTTDLGGQLFETVDHGDDQATEETMEVRTMLLSALMAGIHGPLNGRAREALIRLSGA